MRLDKFLADCGQGSRSQVKGILKKGRVTFEGQTIQDGRFQVDKNSRQVRIDGVVLLYQEFFYYLLNKPQGVVSATRDRQHSTVLELLDPADFRPDLFPVGRLDKNTEGLLLLTNDGKLGHDLTQPKKHVAKEYEARIDGSVDSEIISKFAAGLTLKNGEKVQAAELSVQKIYPGDSRSGQVSDVNIIIHQGKFHQVKRMFEAVDRYVLHLRRIRMGRLILPEDLPLGSYRSLTSQELDLLRE